MSLKNLVSKYITSTEQVLEKIDVSEEEISLDKEKIGEVLDYIKAYFQDAKYYKDKHRFKVSLTSVAYCEGLLDALKLLGAVKFEWLENKERRER
ncbi:MAG: DUF357 domain-containing protein [Thermoproteota archaeon]